MNSLKWLTSTLSATGFFCIVLTFSQPARASISCEAGTENKFSNGSLAHCFLRTDTNTGLNNNVFSCKKGEVISFNEKGQFNSCILSTPINIRKGNEVVKCLADHRVSVAISSNGNQSISCQWVLLVDRMTLICCSSLIYRKHTTAGFLCHWHSCFLFCASSCSSLESQSKSWSK